MIASSTHAIDARDQGGGLFYLIESHTDSTARVHQVGPYLVPAGFDIAGRLAASALRLEEQLADSECDDVLRGTGPIVLAHQTYGRNLTAAEWTALVTTRLLPAAQRYQAMLDEADL